eukprot:6182128-Pleurochrysis_carterae.AAC.3
MFHICANSYMVSFVIADCRIQLTSGNSCTSIELIAFRGQFSIDSRLTTVMCQAGQHCELQYHYQW